MYVHCTHTHTPTLTHTHTDEDGEMYEETDQCKFCV